MADKSGDNTSGSSSSSSWTNFSSWTFSSHSHSSADKVSSQPNGAGGGGGDTANMTPEQKVERQRRVEIARRRKLQEQQDSAKKKPGKIQQIREGYESLVCAVIRPPRSRYTQSDLGPKVVKLDSGAHMERTDFVVLNPQKMTVQCSMWMPRTKDNVTGVVIYLHGNSSCRVDATRTGVLETVGPLGAALVSIDFAGSGLSDGEYVTLGWHEQHDVGAVVNHLTQQLKFKKVALWGRSMGSVAAMMYAENDMYQSMRPVALVLDSPFSSFPQLVDDLIKKGAIRVPRFAIKTILSMVRSSVKKRTGADIYKIEPIKHAQKCKMASLFITADRDEMIPHDHGENLSASWGGPSLQISFRGGHNSPRPPHIYDAAGTFLRAVLKDSEGEDTPQMAEAFKTIGQLCCDDGSGDLPAGWMSATDPDTGDVYYYDLYTHKTTWFRPTKPSVGYKPKQGEGENSAGMKTTPVEKFAEKTRESRKAAESNDAMSPPLRNEGGQFGSFDGFGGKEEISDVKAKLFDGVDEEEDQEALASLNDDEEEEEEEHTIHFGGAEEIETLPKDTLKLTDTNDAATVNLSIW